MRIAFSGKKFEIIGWLEEIAFGDDCVKEFNTNV